MAASIRSIGWRRRADTPPAPADSAALVRQATYADIGAFLFAHDLSISDANFAVARAYLAGDGEVRARIEALLREHRRLDDAMVAAVAARTEAAISPVLVTDAVEQLVGTLTECLGIVARSRKLGDHYEAALAIETVAADGDPAGAVGRVMALTRQVLDATRTMETQLDTARKEASGLRTKLQHARREATIDHLTGLPNRRAFEARLDAIEAEPDRPCCIALCDIDDFKAVNDRHGHDAGDRVLRYVADLLARALGDGVMVARHGGEEFACLFQDCAPDEAATALDEARLRLSERALVNQQTREPIGRLTFSAGIACTGSEPRAALRLADEMLYAAKRGGKNRVIAAR